MRILWSLLLFANSVLAVDPYITKPTGSLPICDKSYFELSNLPPYRDQGSFGTCYAHSSMLLLEHLRCARKASPANCYQDKGSVLHLSRFNNTDSEDMIKIGGDAGSILTRFSNVRKIAKENCAKYEDWEDLEKLYKEERAKLKKSGDDSTDSDIDYFYYISHQIKKGATKEAKTCWANEIINAGIQHNFNDLMSILNSANGKTWEELRYQVLVPKSCKDHSMVYPEYTQVSYPMGKEPRNFKGYRDFIYRVLSAGSPVEVAFCASTKSDGTCGYHSTTIVGQRHVCNMKSCSLQFRIQNSYGQSWQGNNDAGWVDAENLTSLMKNYNTGVNAILPVGKSLDSKLEAPFYEEPPMSSIAKEVTLSESGKVVGFEDKCWKVDGNYPVPVSRPEDEPATPSTIDDPIYKPGGKKQIFLCSGKDGNIFIDHPVEGMDCEEKKY